MGKTAWGVADDMRSFTELYISGRTRVWYRPHTACAGPYFSRDPRARVAGGDCWDGPGPERWCEMCGGMMGRSYVLHGQACHARMRITIDWHSTWWM
jgi:hypothetical protein